MAPRTARDVIDQAVEENRVGERLLYGMACVFGATGVFLIAWAAIEKLPFVAVAGALSTSLLWPSISSARKTRKESVAIRLLEVPLSRADTSEEASAMLHRFFEQQMREPVMSGGKRLSKAKA